MPAFVALGGLAWAAAHWGVHRAASGNAAPGHGAGHPDAPAALGAGYLTTSLALCLGLAVAFAAAASLDGRGGGSIARRLWLFAVVPALGFGAELATAPGELAPAALAVLAVQAALALVAMRLGRGLLGLAESVALTLAGPLRRSGRAGGLASSPGRFDRARALLLLLGGGQRAPPAVSRA
ncbi:MAG TPA: hypothetical protein VD704_12955 [Gaiellaceae bacterium]|nr:hypothetical protein [Gaiellaceae bacterium]